MQRLLRSGQSQIRLTNGKMAVFNPDALEDFEQVLRDADPRQSQPGVYRLKKIQAAYLTNTAEEIGARLIGASQILRANRAARIPRTLESQLRDYQRTGVRWLGRARRAKSRRHPGRRDGSRENRANSRASSARSRSRSRSDRLPDVASLELAARSGAFHAGVESAEDRRCNRTEKIARLPEYDLGLTSYGLLRRDVDFYAGLSLRTVILDEAQHIKNPETQNAQAAFALERAIASFSPARRWKTRCAIFGR